MSLRFFCVLLLLPTALVADNCLECVLGVYDDAGLTQNFGVWDVGSESTKDIWIGIEYGGTSGLDGLTGIEFSVYGLPDSLVSLRVYPLDNPPIVLGNIRAPEDVTECTQAKPCGMNVAWSHCLRGNRALLEISMTSSIPIADDTVIRVFRRFPSRNPEYEAVLFTQCDFPEFTMTRVTGGCYVLNPTVPPGATVDGCALTPVVVVEQETWSKIKELYRD
jgi:hypothetical protein